MVCLLHHSQHGIFNPTSMSWPIVNDTNCFSRISHRTVMYDYGASYFVIPTKYKALQGILLFPPTLYLQINGIICKQLLSGRYVPLGNCLCVSPFLGIPRPRQGWVLPKNIRYVTAAYRAIDKTSHIAMLDISILVHICLCFKDVMDESWTQGLHCFEFCLWVRSSHKR